MGDFPSGVVHARQAKVHHAGEKGIDAQHQKLLNDFL